MAGVFVQIHDPGLVVRAHAAGPQSAAQQFSDRYASSPFMLSKFAA